MRLLLFQLLNHPADAIGGGGKGTAAQVRVGTWWQELRIQHGFTSRWGVVVEAQTASWNRWQPSLGIFSTWYDGPIRLTGTVLGGWLYQSGPIPRNGPSVEARLQLSKPIGRFRPWLLLGTKHSFGYQRNEIQTVEETLIEDSLQMEWTLTGNLGLAIGIHKEWEMGLGLDFPWVNYPSITIPGAHISIAYRGAP